MNWVIYTVLNTKGLSFMSDVFIDDTPMDYNKLPDLTPEECDEILKKAKQEVEAQNKHE